MEATVGATASGCVCTRKKRRERCRKVEEGGRDKVEAVDDAGLASGALLVWCVE
jgi:hypothetical protein